jgi:tRNA threonylcarbamoyladenosine biosynthesis protein TsaB
MSRILLIETSTALCSVALAVDGGIAASRESDQPRSHSAMTAPFIKELLDSCGLFASDLDAVCVSAGPGSYTGLRVGVSTAKGVCFAAGVPLLSVGTLDVLVAQARADGLLPEGCHRVIPMVDARRMEVYTAVYTPDGQRLTEVEPRVIDAESFRQEREAGPVLFIGDGAYGTTEVEGGGLQTIVKQKGSAGTADPLDQRSSVGWKALKTAEILLPSYLIRVEHMTRRYSATASAN